VTVPNSSPVAIAAGAAHDGHAARQARLAAQAISCHADRPGQAEERGADRGLLPAGAIALCPGAGRALLQRAPAQGSPSAGHLKMGQGRKEHVRRVATVGQSRPGTLRTASAGPRYCES